MSEGGNILDLLAFRVFIEGVLIGVCPFTRTFA